MNYDLIEYLDSGSPSTFYHKQGFDDFHPAGFDGVFHWEFLRDAFPRGITPMDIDANVEIKGNFLWFETKKPGVEIPAGQRISLQAHVRNGHTVIFLEGKFPGEIMSAELWHGAHRKPIPAVDGVIAIGVWQAAARWAEWADKTPYFPPPQRALREISIAAEALLVAVNKLRGGR